MMSMQCCGLLTRQPGGKLDPPKPLWYTLVLRPPGRSLDAKASRAPLYLLLLLPCYEANSTLLALMLSFPAMNGASCDHAINA